MSLESHFILMGMGGLFILLGFATTLWGSREEKDYYNAISCRFDVREYIEHKPERPEPGALKIGGWITITIGLLMMVMGGAFWLWG
ncbi:hypothetical protein ACFLTP_07115 [Chloroflexota bacterium]